VFKRSVRDLTAALDGSRKCPWTAIYENTFITERQAGCQSISASHLLGGSPAASPSLQFASTSWANDNQKIRQLLSPPNLIQKKSGDSWSHPSVTGRFETVPKPSGSSPKPLHDAATLPPQERLARGPPKPARPWTAPPKRTTRPLRSISRGFSSETHAAVLHRKV